MFRATMAREIENRLAAQFAFAKIRFRHDQLIIPACRLRHDLPLRVHNDGMAEQLVPIFRAGLGGCDREAGILIAPGLDGQMAMEDTQMRRLKAAIFHIQ